MFKLCMKNYFKNLKYVLLVLGIMFIAYLMGTSFFFKTASNNIQDFAAQISAITKNTDFNLFGVKGGFFQVITNYAEFLKEILGNLLGAAIKLLMSLLAFILIQVIGVWIADMVSFFIGRHNVNHDNVLKVIMEQLFRAFCMIIVLALVFVVMFKVNIYVGLVLLALGILWHPFVSLFCAWFTAGKDERPKWSQCVRFSNMMWLLLSNVVQIIITIAIIAILFTVLDALPAIVVSIAFLEILSVSRNLNAYTMVYNGTYESLPEVSEIENNEIETAEEVTGSKAEETPEENAETIKEASADVSAKASEPSNDNVNEEIIVG